MNNEFEINGTLTGYTGQVASISLPVGVKELAGMVDDLEKKHGKGLVMRKIGNALIISKPNATDEAKTKGVVGVG